MKKSLFLLMCALVPFCAMAYNLRHVSVHDPSVVWDPNSRYYYIFGSHRASAKSKDMSSWTTFTAAWKTTTSNNASNTDAFGFVKHMDGGIWSCDVHMIKPDPGIYKSLFDKYGIVPEECLFISNGKFYYSVGKTKMKGYRAYFSFYDVLKDYESASEAHVFIYYPEEDPAAIVSLDDERGMMAATWYTLDGRKLSVKPTTKGLYIFNGKKIAIK